MGGGGTRTSWEMMGWTEADNKNPHAQRFIFPLIFCSFFLTQLSHLGLKPYSVNSVLPSLYLIPNRWLSPSAIIHTSLPPPICLRLPPPAAPTAPLWPRCPSARPRPILAHHLRLPRHVQNLQSHVPPVQHTRHPPTGPPVQGQLDPSVHPSRELPGAGSYFQSDRRKLGRGTISLRRNRCCESSTERAHLPGPPVPQRVYYHLFPSQSFYVNRPFLILEPPIIGSPNVRRVVI